MKWRTLVSMQFEFALRRRPTGYRETRLAFGPNNGGAYTIARTACTTGTLMAKLHLWHSRDNSG